MGRGVWTEQKATSLVVDGNTVRFAKERRPGIPAEIPVDENFAQLSSQELKERIEKAIKNLNKIEEYIVGADETVGAMKPFIYEKIGGDTEIPTQKE